MKKPATAGRLKPIGWVCPKCGHTFPIQPVKLSGAPECNRNHSTTTMKEYTK